MADLFTVTAPLALLCPNDTRKAIAAGYPYLNPGAFWHLSAPHETAHLIPGCSDAMVPGRSAGASLALSAPWRAVYVRWSR